MHSRAGFSTTTLVKVVERPIAGLWGADARRADATIPCRVVRNGDVRKDGRILVEELPIRWWSELRFAPPTRF